MAIGDDAVAAGMSIVDGATTDANTIDTEINRSRDYIAQGKGATDAATPDKVIKRDANGRAKVAAPSAGGDIVNKTYADALGDPALTPNTIVRRNADGRFNVGTPTGSDNATPKAYVDSADSSLLSAVNDVANGELNSAVYNRDITSTRRAVWVSTGGTLGYASSARAKKQNIVNADLTLEQLLGIPVVLYRYRKAVAAERKGGDPAPTEIGTIADDLHALGLWHFVIYEGHGETAKPIGVHYEMLSLAALSLGQQLATRLVALEDRVSALES